MDEVEFVVPKRRKKAGAKKRKQDDAVSVCSTNPYDSLSESEDVENPGGSSKARTSESTTRKLPPIVVVNWTLTNLQTICAKLGIKATFKLSRVGIKIGCRSLEEYKKLMGFLEKSDAQFFTHDLPGAKPYKVVVRGMPESVPSSLMDQLTAEYGLKPVAVYPIKRREGVYRDTLYLLHFPAGTITLKQLKEEVKTISSVVVTWDRYRPKKRDVTMCQNCQNFGHGTRHCHRASRCGFCGGNHSTDACLQKDAENAVETCANCSGQHRATSRSCPKRAEFLKIRDQATKPKQTIRPVQAPAAPAFSDSNFPPLPANKSDPPGLNHHPPGSAKWAGIQQQSSSPLFTAAELAKIWAEMMSALRGCKTKHEQIAVLGHFAIQYSV